MIKSPKRRGQVLWSITLTLEAFFASIELKSVSAALRTDDNLNKVHFFSRERYVVDIKN